MKNIFKKTNPVLLLVIVVILIIAFLSLYSASYQPGRDLVKNYSMQQLLLSVKLMENMQHPQPQIIGLIGKLLAIYERRWLQLTQSRGR